MYDDIAPPALRMPPASPAGDAGDLNRSWQRCVQLHQLNPMSCKGPDILSAAETQRLRTPLEPTIALAQEELERLHLMLRPLGYATLLADGGGVILDRYCGTADAESFSRHGSRPGARWTECSEGTNGIGTCIVEQRPLSVHRRQHFRQRYAELSCSGAPIFDAAGSLQAVLNVASCDPAVSERSHALALAVVVDAAHAIEERIFRDSHRRDWVLALRADAEGPGVLLAADAEHRILAADRRACGALGTNATGRHLRDLFECFPMLHRGRGSGDLAVALQQCGGARWQGLLTPPQAGADQLHIRPRRALLGGLGLSPAQPRGCLPPRLLRELRQHIAGHLERNIPVEELAAMAGLSAPHFSRAFKISTGLAPHHYLTQQRVDMAAQLLAGSTLGLAQIAQAVGFSDQSHFSRSFSRLSGMTPSAYRRAQR